MLFLGLLFRKEEEKELLELSNRSVSNATNTFQWNLINGFEKIVPLDIINVLPVGTYPKQYKRLLLNNKKWSFKGNVNNLEIGAINLPFLKQWTRYIKIKRELNSRISNDNSLNNIVIYSAYLPFLKAIYKLNRRINITLIVPDLPEYYELGRVSIVRKILRKINNYFIYKYCSRIDSFVLLTEQMKSKLQVGDRPYVVIEGVVDTENINNSLNNASRDKKNAKKIILYTGTLRNQYGILDILEAFKLINNNEYELWICGSGEAEEEIKRYSSKDKRIKFFGFLMKNEIKKLEQQATLLINPRPNEGEYTKYSFPSKTMEYLISGKPVLMHKLDGIPDEYNDYIYYFSGIQPKDIASKIIEIMEKSEEDRKEFGELARQFVIKNKNNVAQAHKILKMLNRS